MEQCLKKLEVLVQKFSCSLQTFLVHTGTTKSRAPLKNFLEIADLIVDLKRVFVIYKIYQFICLQGNIS